MADFKTERPETQLKIHEIEKPSFHERAESELFKELSLKVLALCWAEIWLTKAPRWLHTKALEFANLGVGWVGAHLFGPKGGKGGK